MYRLIQLQPNDEDLVESDGAGSCWPCLQAKVAAWLQEKRGDPDWLALAVEVIALGEACRKDYSRFALERYRAGRRFRLLRDGVLTITRRLRCGNPLCDRPIFYAALRVPDDNPIEQPYPADLRRYYCTRHCRTSSWPSQRPRRAIATCAACGVEFPQRRSDAKYCCNACRQRHHRRAHAASTPTAVGAHDAM
jgi:hypothetical protein